MPDSSLTYTWSPTGLSCYIFILYCTSLELLELTAGAPSTKQDVEGLPIGELWDLLVEHDRKGNILSCRCLKRLFTFS